MRGARHGRGAGSRRDVAEHEAVAFDELPSMSIGAEKPGPSYTKVWNSPRSPHGSTPAGRSASSYSSKVRPANSPGSRLESTQVSTAPTPAASTCRASLAVGRPDSGNRGVIPIGASICSREARTSSRNRSPNTMWLTLVASAVAAAAAVHCYTPDWSTARGVGWCRGRPRRSAWDSTRIRRIPCMATRSA